MVGAFRRAKEIKPILKKKKEERGLFYCPFCESGNVEEIIHTMHGCPCMAFVICHACGARGPENDNVDDMSHIIKWNERKTGREVNLR